MYYTAQSMLLCITHRMSWRRQVGLMSDGRQQSVYLLSYQTPITARRLLSVSLMRTACRPRGRSLQSLAAAAAAAAALISDCGCSVTR